jgi:hypothetical protein
MRNGRNVSAFLPLRRYASPVSPLLLRLELSVLPFLETAKASLDQLGGTGMERFANQVTIMTQSQQHLLAENDLKKTFRFLLQPGAPSALCLTKLDSAFLALLGGELRHWVLVIISVVKGKSSAFH